MQIYTQNPNRARKNMNFFESTSFLKVNESTGQRVNEFFFVLKGLLWVCYGVCEKNHTYLIH